MLLITKKLVFKKGFWDELQYFDFFEAFPDDRRKLFFIGGADLATGYPAVCRAGAQFGLVCEQSSKRRRGSHADLEIFLIYSHY